MNIQLDRQHIVDVLQSFAQKKKLYSSSPAIPHSGDSFFQQPLQVDQLDNCLKLNNLINRNDVFHFPYKKVPRIIPKVTLFNGVVYSNLYRESLIDINTTDNTKVLLGYVNKDNEFTDMRVQGGGLKPNYINQEFATNMFIGSYFDVGRFDGIPTQIQTTVIVELPQSILGSFTKLEIETAVYKYIAAGVYPIIRFYEG